jgi:hypothetical protein
MLEFVFFDPQPRRKFAEFLRARGLAPTEREDDETQVVAIPEDVDDALLDTIEAFYDEMMALDRELFEAGADGDDGGHQAAGVVLNLASGQTVYARVAPQLLGRIMEVLTPQEFGEVVNAIVDAVEHPDDRPLCHRPDEGG